MSRDQPLWSEVTSKAPEISQSGLSGTDKHHTTLTRERFKWLKAFKRYMEVDNKIMKNQVNS